jgi:mRNA interferase MazF
MPAFEQGDVVRVPFPYIDRNRRQHRPALVISTGGIGPGEALLWVVMITSADNEPWQDDVVIEDHVGVGLPVPSVIRPVKVATIEAARAERVGHAPQMTVDKVMARVRAVVGQQEH